MKRVLIPCDQPTAQAGLDTDGFDRVLPIGINGAPRNLRIESIDEQVYEQLQPVCADLVRVAAYVYAADRLLSRGEKDPYGDRWRQFHRFVIPVSDPDLWNSDDLRHSLCRALTFLTDHEYEFLFVDGGMPRPGQASLFRDPRFTEADSVALFSGGLDSLSGTVYDHVLQNTHPILVSHRPAPQIDHRQRRLVALMRDRFPRWRIAHTSTWVSLRGKWSQENSQRSRSFLYLALAAAIAHHFGKDRVTVYENGVVSINLPITAELVGARVTRTTHPKFLMLLSEFLLHLLGRRIRIETPFLWLTKGEVTRRLAAAGHADLAEASTSCSRTYMVTKAEPHCGVCSQCLDRRVALEWAGMRPQDSVYRHDMFSSSLGQVDHEQPAANARSMVLSYIRTHLRIATMTADQFLAEFGQIDDVIDGVPGDAGDVAEKIYGLYQRQAEAVREALQKAHEAGFGSVLHGNLPSDCLLRMVWAGEHLREPVERLARRLIGIAEAALPLSFAHRAPEGEVEVQDALHAVLNRDREDLRREFPSVEFAVKQAKPDFAIAGERLLIEAKYVRSTRTPGAISGEIAEDITIYGRKGTPVLFVVYDPERRIADRRSFTAQVEDPPRVFACVI